MQTILNLSQRFNSISSIKRLKRLSFEEKKDIIVKTFIAASTAVSFPFFNDTKPFFVFLVSLSTFYALSKRYLHQLKERDKTAEFTQALSRIKNGQVSAKLSKQQLIKEFPQQVKSARESSAKDKRTLEKLEQEIKILTRKKHEFERAIKQMTEGEERILETKKLLEIEIDKLKRLIEELEKESPPKTDERAFKIHQATLGLKKQELAEKVKKLAAIEQPWDIKADLQIEKDLKNEIKELEKAIGTLERTRPSEEKQLTKHKNKEAAKNKQLQMTRERLSAVQESIQNNRNEKIKDKSQKIQSKKESLKEILTKLKEKSEQKIALKNQHESNSKSLKLLKYISRR